jgi:alpha-1,2-mannosyltransferase
MPRPAAISASIESNYVRLTVAGATFFFCIEFIYFMLSDTPSFWVPSLDALGQTAIGRDFLNTWMGGRSAFSGGPAAWFDAPVYNKFLREFMGVPYVHDYFWSYPPHILLFIWPFGLLPYFPAFLLWTFLGLAVFLYAAAGCGVERKHLLFVAVAPAVAINVFIGQNGFFTAALLIGGLSNLDRRPILAGVLFGILSVKPQLGLLLPLVLALHGRWRTIAAAAATVIALVAVTALIWGPDIWTAYLAKVLPQQHRLQEHQHGLLFRMIPSIFYGARVMGLPVGVAWAMQAIVSAVGLAAVIWTYWRRRDPGLSVALLITAIFIISPYSLSYDLVVLGWVVALLRQREDMQPADHYLLMAVWAMPAAMLLNTELKIPTAAIVLSAFAARLVWRLAREEVAPQQTSHDPEPARKADPHLVAAPAFARARTLHGLRLADRPMPSNWPHA